MKRLLAVVLSAIIVAGAFAGCSAKTDTKASSEVENTAVSGEVNESTSDPAVYDKSTTKKPEGVEKFDGVISIKWADTEAEYTKLEATAKSDVDSAKLDKKYVIDLLKQVRSDASKLVEGVNKDNIKTSKDLYLTACKISAVAAKNSSLVNDDIKSIPDDVKNLIKQYHGVAEVDFTPVKTNVNAKAFAGESWLNDAWSDNKSAFKEAEKLAKESASNVESVSADEVKSVVSAVKVFLNKYDFATVEEGNEYQIAKDIYRFGYEINALGKGNDGELASQLTSLGQDLMTYSYHFVGKETSGFDELKTNINNALDTIGSMEDKEIQNQVESFK